MTFSLIPREQDDVHLEYDLWGILCDALDDLATLEPIIITVIFQESLSLEHRPDCHPGHPVEPGDTGHLKLVLASI